MQTRAVLFDFGGVFTDSPFGALGGLAEKLGADPAVLMEVVFGPYHEDTDHPWHRLERGELELVRARDEILALGNERGIEADPFQLFAAMGRSGARQEWVDAVQGLRVRKIQTALVTNNVKEFSQAWRNLIPVDELFDVVVDSSEVGVRKPDPRIFQLALEQLGGIPPHEAVFFDDYAGNVHAAEALGIRGVLVEADSSSALVALAALI